MDTMARRVLSGLIGALAGALVMGFAIGMVTLFLGSIPGALLGYGLGFWWGFKRVDEPTQTSTPRTAGDTAILIATGSGALWLSIAIASFFFGYSGAYKGHMLGWMLPILGIIAAPCLAIIAERGARRKLDLLQRDIAGLGLLLFLLLTIFVWWRWAEARDQNRAYRGAGNVSAHVRSTLMLCCA